MVSELVPASSQNVKKPIQSLCTNVFKTRPWVCYFRSRGWKSNGRGWQASRARVTLWEKWAVNTFFVLFPPYIGLGVWGGVFSFLVSTIRKKLDSILLLGCALLKWVDVFTFKLSAPRTQFAVWPWLSLSWLASQPWGQEWPHHVKKEGTRQVSWAAYTPFSLLCPFLGYI